MIGAMHRPFEPRHIAKIRNIGGRRQRGKISREVVAVIEQHRRAGRCLGDEHLRNMGKKVISHQHPGHWKDAAQRLTQQHPGITAVNIEKGLAGPGKPRASRLFRRQHGAGELLLQITERRHSPSSRQLSR